MIESTFELEDDQSSEYELNKVGRKFQMKMSSVRNRKESFCFRKRACSRSNEALVSR